MSTLICNKCNTSNKEGVDKCSTCGFPFSNNKMSTVGKYLGEFAPKPTILDAVSSGTFKHKPTLLDEDAFSQSNKETNIENDLPSAPLTMDQNEVFYSQDLGQELPENRPIEIENQIFSNEVTLVKETERIVQETIDTPEKPSESNEHNCVKCGYILSDFSTVCPSCGHNNIIANATMRMPLPSENASLASNHLEKTIAEPNPIHATSAYPSLSKQKDPSRTISEPDPKTHLTYKEEMPLLNPNVTQRHEVNHSNNKTIREGYYDGENDVENNSTQSNPPSEPTDKSPVRLEAIYLGQDSDQKMIINMPLQTNLLNITRSLVDEGDSTISSGIHATIYKEGDEWKIENKASNKAVFVQVNDTSSIKNGDIIMMGGDKFYVFVDESNK